MTFLGTALPFPVTGPITAQGGAIPITDMSTILTRLTQIQMIPRSRMIIHTPLSIRTRTHTFIQTHTHMFMRTPIFIST
jgi:hypothetical protein